MRFLSTRDLRNRPGYVRELARQDDLVLTANGKPIAILVGVEEDEFEETARAIRQAKAQRALSRMRRQAARLAAIALREPDVVLIGEGEGAVVRDVRVARELDRLGGGGVLRGFDRAL